jgi:hypothetical protein
MSNTTQHWQAVLVDIVERERKQMRDEIVAVLGELQSCTDMAECEHCYAVAECIERILRIDAL